MPKSLDARTLETLRSACRKRDYAFGVTIAYPGFHMRNCYVHGGIEALSYAEMDTPEILQEWFERDLERGTPQLVEHKAIQAMHDAGQGGGFILSTGDQYGRETPDDNIFAIVQAAKKYGRYDPATGVLPDLPPSFVVKHPGGLNPHVAFQGHCFIRLKCYNDVS